MIKLKDILYEGYSLSKEDEGRALNFIYRAVIPLCVKSWNKKMNDSVSENDVKKSIRKTEHKTFPEQKLHDSIRYSCKIPTKKKRIASEATFEFLIWKDREGMVQAGYEHPYSGGVVSYFIDDETILQDLKENLLGVGNKPKNYNITKMEEQLALQKIKEVWGKVHGEELGKTIKKVKDVRRSDMLVSDLIDYESIIRGRPMRFAIRKDGEGVFVAKIEKDQAAYVPDHKWISVGNLEKVTEGYSNTEEKLKDKKAIQYAMAFLVKIVIPDAVKDHNDMVEYFNDHPDERSHRLWFDAMKDYAEKKGITDFKLRTTTPQEVSKYLKRIKPTEEFLIQFESMLPGGMVFDFYINHSEEYEWSVGYHNYHHRKEWDLKRWDPYNPSDDKADYLLENKLGMKIRIKEVEQKGDDSITKMEEQYAYNYLVRQILTKAIEDSYYKFIKKYPNRYPERKYPRITVNDIAKNLKKNKDGF